MRVQFNQTKKVQVWKWPKFLWLTLKNATMFKNAGLCILFGLFVFIVLIFCWYLIRIRPLLLCSPSCCFSRHFISCHFYTIFLNSYKLLSWSDICLFIPSLPYSYSYLELDVNELFRCFRWNVRLDVLKVHHSLCLCTGWIFKDREKVDLYEQNLNVSHTCIGHYVCRVMWEMYLMYTIK